MRSAGSCALDLEPFDNLLLSFVEGNEEHVHVLECRFVLELTLQYREVEVSYQHRLVYRRELMVPARTRQAMAILIKAVRGMIVLVLVGWDLGRCSWVKDRMIFVRRGLLLVLLLIHHSR